MATIKYYSMDTGELEGLVNQVKEQILVQLEKDGLLESGEGISWGTEHSVILASKGALGAWIDKLLGLDGEAARAIIVKVPQP